MKFQPQKIIPTKKCLEHKCKTCPKRIECDLIYKTEEEIEHLTYKPFENLKELIHGNNE